MAKVSINQTVSKTVVSEAFNIRAKCNNGVVVGVEYKPGFRPWYSNLFCINADMIPQLIDVLQGMQNKLSETSDGESK